MIIESRPPGPALSPWATRRGAERARPAPWEATGLEGAHLRINGLGRGPVPRVGTRRRSRPGPCRSPGDRSAQRPARVPGPLFEQSGEQAIGPSDHRPRPNRSARTSRPTPHRNATAPPHPRPPTRAITSSVITYRSFQIKGTHRQLNTPCCPVVLRRPRMRCPWSTAGRLRRSSSRVLRRTPLLMVGRTSFRAMCWRSTLTSST